MRTWLKDIVLNNRPDHQDQGYETSKGRKLLQDEGVNRRAQKKQKPPQSEIPMKCLSKGKK